MRARIFDSVEQMVSADGLASLIGSAVESVECAPLDAEHFSGNTLERVRAVCNGQVVRFVMKRFSMQRDWIMRLTQDYEVREVALFRGGVFARMPDLCIVPIIAAARDGKSWASLMIDVSDSLVPNGAAPIPTADLKRYLDHLAAIHARFMEDESLLHPSLGLSAVRDFILILAPNIVRREIEAGRSHPVLEWAVRGWEIFDEVAPPEAVRVVKKVQQDLRPLLRVLARAPRTLVHGDYKLGNLGTWTPPPVAPLPSGGGGDGVGALEPRTIILDWQGAAFGSPLLDIGYFLAINSARLSVSKEEAIQMYRDSLASFGYPYQPHAWARDLEVGLLAGGAMRLTWQKALGTQSDDTAVRKREANELQWWSEQIVRGGRWLG